MGKDGKRSQKDECAGVETLPLAITLTVYLSYAILMIFGYIRDVARKSIPYCLPKRKLQIESPKKVSMLIYRISLYWIDTCTQGYAPLLSGFEDFFTRRLYRRSRDCWNRPISSAPGPWIDVMERETNDYNETYT